MRARYANEMTEGCRVDATFVLESKEVRVARNGDAYLSLRLADRSGAIGGVYFRPSATATAIPRGTVVAAIGTVTSYRGRKLVELSALRPADSWDPVDLATSSTRPVEELHQELTELVKSVKASDMRRVLRIIFGDKEVFSRFSACPATADGHHAYLHGLIEHTVATARVCAGIAARYAEVDRDLLVTAALVHDIGVIDGLCWDAGISVTEHGRLVGHVITGVQRVHVAAQRAKLAPHRAAQLEHALVAHHSTIDPSGSPSPANDRPATLEALLLGHADQLDSAVSDFCQASAHALRADEHWTSASNQLGRPLHAPVGALDAEAGLSLAVASQVMPTTGPVASGSSGRLSA